MSVDFWIAIFKSSTCSTCIILMINVSTVSWCPCHSRYLECKLYKSKILIQIENVTLPKTDRIYQSKRFNNSRTVQKEISDSKAIFFLYLAYKQKLTWAIHYKTTWYIYRFHLNSQNNFNKNTEKYKKFKICRK